MHTYIYIHTYIHVYQYIYAYICIYIYVYIYVFDIFEKACVLECMCVCTFFLPESFLHFCLASFLGTAGT